MPISGIYLTSCFWQKQGMGWDECEKPQLYASGGSMAAHGEGVYMTMNWNTAVSYAMASPDPDAQQNFWRYGRAFNTGESDELDEVGFSHGV